MYVTVPYNKVLFSVLYIFFLPANRRLILEWPSYFLNDSVGRVRGQVIHCRKIGIRTGFTPSTFIFPRHFIPPPSPHSSPSTRCPHQKNKRAKPGKIPESKAFLEIGGRWIEKRFHLFLSRDGLSEDIAGDSCTVCVVTAHAYTGSSKKMDGIWNRYNLNSTCFHRFKPSKKKL